MNRPGEPVFHVGDKTFSPDACLVEPGRKRYLLYVRGGAVEARMTADGAGDTLEVFLWQDGKVSRAPGRWRHFGRGVAVITDAGQSGVTSAAGWWTEPEIPEVDSLGLQPPLAFESGAS
jgi:hypothetical protein